MEPHGVLISLFSGSTDGVIRVGHWLLLVKLQKFDMHFCFELCCMDTNTGTGVQQFLKNKGTTCLGYDN